MKLIEQLELVQDEASFLEFIRALKTDREAEGIKSDDLVGRGKNGWENHSIEDFLGAALSWAEDSNFGMNQGMDNAALWKRFAVFLYCGKIYE
ncbi:DUF7660 family protein [Undibacterium sp. SXout11W]|uniref:DUF7660 family protein n=1 Tax=Undibacterium sp. SXout11W TaxID=3413050 RepID=UPI003BF3AE2D